MDRQHTISIMAAILLSRKAHKADPEHLDRVAEVAQRLYETVEEHESFVETNEPPTVLAHGPTPGGSTLPIDPAERARVGEAR